MAKTLICDIRDTTGLNNFEMALRYVGIDRASSIKKNIYLQDGTCITLLPYYELEVEYRNGENKRLTFEPHLNIQMHALFLDLLKQPAFIEQERGGF